MNYIKVEDWLGRGLYGWWEFSYKINGVRALSDGSQVWSRRGKPLYGMNHLAHRFKDAEVYCGSFEDTVSVVRSHHGRPVEYSELFHLDKTDKRILIKVVKDPTAIFIQELANASVLAGHEGIVMKQGDCWLRLKPRKTYDVPITGVIMAQSHTKIAGLMAALVTPMGKVGTGFSDSQRAERWEIGTTIEIECDYVTAAGKFSKAAFVRRRPDKD